MVDKYVAVGCEALPSMEGRTDHLRVARLLQDKLEAFIASTGKDGAELQTILDVAKTELANSANNCEAINSAVITKRVKKVAAHDYKQIVCGHSCLEHEELIRPSLWENLPRDLLPPIFARLPLPAIARLQSVSKAWQKNISSIDSDFSRELEAVNHSRVALISPVLEIPSKFQVNIYDVQAKEWHCYDMHVTFAASSRMGAADGGLVCFVSIELNGPLSIMVINPFTLASRNLPYPQNLRDVQPTMVHLSVDAQTGKYKVVVAGYNANDGGRELEAEVYNSETDHWTKIDSSERIYGHAFHWKVNRMTYQLEDPVLGPCVYAEEK